MFRHRRNLASQLGDVFAEIVADCMILLQKARDTGNEESALSTFRHDLTDLWRRALRRRSQKDGFTRDRMTKLAASLAVHPASPGGSALHRHIP